MGSVWEGTLFKQQVAVKVIDLTGRESQLEFVAKEAKVLLQASHEHIVRYYGWTTIDSCLYLFMEKMAGSLDKRLNIRKIPMGEYNPKPVPIVTKLKMLKDAALALQFLHGRDDQILHLDLKPANLLHDEQDCIKIADMGISELLKRGSEARSKYGTAGYSAPEQAYEQKETPKSDVFSFGVVMYEIIFQRRAFPGSQMDWLRMIFAAKTKHTPLRLDFPEMVDMNTPCHPDIKELIVTCLQVDQEKRQDFNLIVDKLTDFVQLYTLRDDDAFLFWKSHFSGKVSHVTRVIQVEGSSSRGRVCSNLLERISRQN
eukprot:TRINITY_DN3635_c0_g1_i3.p1 TRINITY_DN3635_c0_g1~~TRINITY_DN3635_c0_g1_i3.p1  ORF type:complete len:347 (-),score=131.30 TRINITY_DN3635_c0_g1_i3:709-1650(-)